MSPDTNLLTVARGTLTLKCYISTKCVTVGKISVENCSKSDTLGAVIAPLQVRDSCQVVYIKLIHSGSGTGVNVNADQTYYWCDGECLSASIMIEEVGGYLCHRSSATTGKGSSHNIQPTEVPPLWQAITFSRFSITNNN